jgi:spore coat polysaccharide biosynthesis predicted glycosyltransferase SpsG/L-amino acid N-acyltransferase YncA
MVIDDLANRVHDCDILLDQNLVKDLTQRYDKKLPDHCGRLLGPRFALLQSHYAALHQQVLPRHGAIRTILVYFGGADTDNLSGRAINAFISLKRSDIQLHVVIRSSSLFAASIHQQVKKYPSITVYEDLPSLAPLMAQADLAIGAGGATSWERCCLGLPTFVITLAENQQPIAAELHQQNYIRWLGDKDDVSETIIAEALHAAIIHGLSAEWSHQCHQLVDGLGGKRVASLLMLNADTKLRARLARIDDELQILSWANDPLVRKTAFSQGRIEPQVHHQWFQKRLHDPEHCRLYVIETEDECPLGQVRFELNPMHQYWEISYALDPAARGHGLGKIMLQIAMQDLRHHLGSVLVLGRVKVLNRASSRVFEVLGFNSEQIDEQTIAYQYQL